MDTFVQIIALAMMAAVCACVIRPLVSSVSMGLVIFTCATILLLSFRFLSPVLEVAERLRTLSGLPAAATAPMLKVAAIGVLAQISGAICEDAGEKTLQNAVQIGSVVLSLYVSLPLMSAVLDLLEEVLQV